MTNVNDGETNGIAANAPLVEPCTSEGKKVQGLPDDNVLYLLRDVAKKSDGHTLYHGVTKLMQAIGKEPEDRRETGSELAVALNTLADMIERDYVSRQDFEAQYRTLCVVREQRDELQSRHCPHYHVREHYCDVHETRIEALIAERDEWKTKAEQAHDTMDRMQAVIDGYEDSTTDLESELDEWKAKAEACNPCGWWNNSLQYCERNDDLPTENDVSAEAVDANDGEATQDMDSGVNVHKCPNDGTHESYRQYADQRKREETPDCESDSREKLEADVRKHYAYSTTTLMYPPSANKTTDMLRSLPIDTVVGWLDRQAAITGQQYKENFTGFGLLHDLNEQGLKVKYLPSERRFTFDCPGCEWPSLAAQPDQEAYDRIAELQDELAATKQELKLARGQLTLTLNNWEQAKGKLRRQKEALDDRERKIEAREKETPDDITRKHIEKLEQKLEQCEAEREMYRMKFSVACDLADEIKRNAD